jgi:alpha/beta superfamily hydrolase
MSINAEYQPLHEQVRNLQFQIKDSIGDHNHPSAQLLHHEMEHLENELESGKNPRDIENRIKTIQHTLLEARSQPNSYMNINHADHFYRTYEDMRRSVRQFHDYS